MADDWQPVQQNDWRPTGGKATLSDVGNQALADIKAVPGKIWDAVKGIPYIPARVGQAATEYGQTGEYNPAPFMEAASLASPLPAAMRAGERAIPGVATALRPVKVEPPSAEALKASGAKNINAARDMGVEFSANGVKTMASGARSGLEQDGILGELAPKTFSILHKLENPPDGAFATLAGIEAARRSLGHAAKDFSNPTERLAASRVIDGLDSFLAKPPAESVLAGPASAAGNALERGRADYAAAMRSNKITGELDNAYTGMLDRAELGAAAANSGHNIDNSIRQRAKSLLQNRKDLNGFSASEIGKLQTVAEGTPVTNAIRHIANLLGGGGGMGQAMVGAASGTAGLAAGGPVGAAIGLSVPLVGAGLKEASGALTKRQARLLDEAIRQRSPLFQDMQREAGMKTAPAAQRAAFARALLLLGQQQQ